MKDNFYFEDTLPPANTTRWVIRRKAQVVAGVKKGLITLADACSRYNITEEEFASWERSINKYGLKGLKATKVQHYRDVASVESTKKFVEQAIEEHANVASQELASDL